MVSVFLLDFSPGVTMVAIEDDFEPQAAAPPQLAAANTIESDFVPCFLWSAQQTCAAAGSCGLKSFHLFGAPRSGVASWRLNKLPNFVVLKQKHPFFNECFCNQQLLSLPGRFQPSTFSVCGLNFCVRYGNRWNPTAIVTGFLTTDCSPVVYVKRVFPQNWHRRKIGVQLERRFRH